MRCQTAARELCARVALGHTHVPMRPVVFTLLGQPVHAYFFFLSVGFTFAILLAARRTYEEEIPIEEFLNMAIAIFAAAIVGSRAFFVWEAWDHYRGNPLEILRFWHGGLAFYGGFTFGGVAGLAYILWARLPIGRVTDLCAPYIVLGHIFGKVGCFFHGCCYGKPTDGSWGFAFPGTAHDLLLRHPSQLYEFAGLIAIFVGLHLLRLRRPVPGTLIGVYLIAYGVLRFLLEYTRDDMVGPAFYGLYRYQWTSVAMASLGALVLIRVRVWSRR